jgi:hypothetical protein
MSDPSSIDNSPATHGELLHRHDERLCYLEHQVFVLKQTVADNKVEAIRWPVYLILTQILAVLFVLLLIK